MEKHVHIYDADGNQLCCTLEEKIDRLTSPSLNAGQDSCCDHAHTDAEAHGHDHSQTHDGNSGLWMMFRPALFSLVLLLTGIILDRSGLAWYTSAMRILIYLAAYLPVGWPVLRDAWMSIRRGEVFSEFFLMTIATLGAIFIGEYPEAVTVMLFYTIGENLQTLAVRRAKANIKAMLDQRPDMVTVIDDGIAKSIPAGSVVPGSIIQLSPGEKVGLDGILITDLADFNTAALTGESIPASRMQGEEVLAGMINLHKVSRVRVTKKWEDSKLSHILQMVQDASSRKAPTELFIRKFAKIYTPIVVLLAAGICLLPYFLVEDYQFRDWLYRALIFLVISCPCALVISIPLGYFGGIGAASRNGILVKGGNYLDTLAALKHVVVDKTGTMTRGVFEVRDIVTAEGIDRKRLLQQLKTLQSYSTHPVASAVRAYVTEDNDAIEAGEVHEVAGKGLAGVINGRMMLAGNLQLLRDNGVAYDPALEHIPYTIVAIAVDGHYAGYVTIADAIREEASQVVDQLRDMGVGMTMLSGDRQLVVDAVASELNIRNAYGGLLPEDKVTRLKQIRSEHAPLAFVGDGMNDAPVLALSDVGIAMGGLGSDMAIESADIVIQDDDVRKLPLAIRIGKKTRQIVWQNITLAFGVKAIVLILGATGEATMWEAVFADVGVALLAVANAIRVQRL